MRLVAGLFVLISILSGCDSDAIVEPGVQVDFQIHLQTRFDGDQVAVKLDGEEVFSARISTNSEFSVAEVVPLSIEEGRHSLAVLVNDTVLKVTDFRTREGIKAIVNFDPDTEDLRIEMVDHEIGYA